MKINKFVKKANGMYELVIEDNTVLVHEDLILKYDLLIKKSLDDELLKKIEEENISYIAKDMSIKYLSKRMRSKYEIEKYLYSNDIDNENIKVVIDYLTKNNFINDEIYAKSYILDKINLSQDGPNKIINELKELKIDYSYIEKYISLYNNEIEKSKIDKLIDKIIRTTKNKSAYMLKNKIINSLYEKGYNKYLIDEVLDSKEINDDKELKQKEYDKLYKKYSKKYSGDALELKIKLALKAKGFF